jgi:pyrroloquinoline quinone biosynthesis protein B
MHASLAVSADGCDWFVVNVTPDIRMQIEATPALRPNDGLRGTPIRAALLTDAELDHTLGLLQLREGSRIAVYATATVLEALSDGMPIRRVLEPYTELDWREVCPGVAFDLDAELTVETLALRGSPPRYASHETVGDDWVVAYRFTDSTTGAVAAYAPAVAGFTPALEEFLGTAEWLFFDGTFWADDELRAAAGRPLSASETGHLPISGAHGSARRLASLPASRKVYVHVNNTNPILDARSPERMELAARGLEVGEDGMEVEI